MVSRLSTFDLKNSFLRYIILNTYFVTILISPIELPRGLSPRNVIDKKWNVLRLARDEKGLRHNFLF